VLFAHQQYQTRGSNIDIPAIFNSNYSNSLSFEHMAASRLFPATRPVGGGQYNTIFAQHANADIKIRPGDSDCLFDYRSGAFFL